MPEYIGVIGGSSAYDLLKQNAITGENLGKQNTPYGESHPIIRVQSGGARFFFLSRHGQSRYSITAPFVNYRANIYALRDLGVRSVIAWSGPGSLREDLSAGRFVLPDDIIDETKNRPHTFYENKGIGFIRTFPTFCPALRGILRDVLKEMGENPAEAATYVCTEGPRLETRAEIRKYAQFGGDLVGMTLAPEAFLARELEMCYAAVCCVTNYAESVRERAYRPGTLFEGLATPEEAARVQEAILKFPEIITRTARAAAEAQPVCSCRQAMERYRRRGDIGDDWRDWVAK